MRNFKAGGLCYDGEKLQILDQTLLPETEKWLDCDSVSQLVDLIKRLAIRGAPAIGIAAAILTGIYAKNGATANELHRLAKILIEARPTAVNLQNYMTRLSPLFELADCSNKVIAEVENIYREDRELCSRMSMLGAGIVGKGEHILTHCNTGSLTTAGIGTAMGVILTAHLQKKDIFVWIDETRPLLQGGRLTAWECLKNNIPHKIICDSVAGMLMQQGKVHRILVGSDRIATNGDFANKIGTYQLAVLAKYHNVPFYVVAPSTTIDPDCKSGQEIPIEQRDPCEVGGVTLATAQVRWAPERSEGYNPAFDVTPRELVTGWILENGIFDREDVEKTHWWQTS